MTSAISINSPRFNNLISLPKPQDILDPAQPYNVQAKEFIPVKGINNTMAKAVPELIKQIDSMAGLGRFKRSRTTSRLWKRFKNAPETEWLYRKIPDQHKTRYAIKTHRRSGESETFTADLNDDNSVDVKWKIAGFLPGTLKTRITDIKASALKASAAKFEETGLTRLRDLTGPLTNATDYAFNPQSSFHILLNEAKWLVEFVKKKKFPRVRTIGDYQLKTKRLAATNTYSLESFHKKTGDAYRGLKVVTNKKGEIIEILRHSNFGKYNHSIQIFPADDNPETSLEDNAAMYLIDQKKAKQEMEASKRSTQLKINTALIQDWISIGGDTGYLLTIQEQESNHHDKVSQPVALDDCIKKFNVGYSAKFAKERQEHRELLFGDENLPNLLESTGLVYRNPNSRKELAQVRTNKERELLKDFYNYTGMQPGELSFAFKKSFNKGTRNCELRNIDGEFGPLRSFGDRDLRKVALNQAVPVISSNRFLERYLRAIGSNISGEETNKKIYRWGIRAAKDRLAQHGIFYQENKDGSETVVLADLGGVSTWGHVSAKRVIANRVHDICLEHFPMQEVIQSTIPRKNVKGIVSPNELRAVLKEIGFKVPDDIETEKILLEKLQVRDRKDPITKYLLKAERRDRSTRRAQRIGLKVVKRKLDEQGCRDIEELKIGTAESTAAAPYIKYEKGGKTFLGPTNCWNLKRERRDRVKAEVKKYAKKHKVEVEPVIIKLKKLDTAKRDVEDFVIQSLAA